MRGCCSARGGCWAYIPVEHTTVEAAMVVFYESIWGLKARWSVSLHEDKDTKGL